MLKFNFMTFLLLQIKNIYINSESPIKDIQNDTKIYLTFSNCKSPLINPVFDHGLSSYNIKSPDIGLHLTPFEWSSPSKYSNILNS